MRPKHTSDEEERSDRGKLQISRDFILLFSKLGEEEGDDHDVRVQAETPKRGTWLGVGHSKGGGWSPGSKVHACPVSRSCVF